MRKLTASLLGAVLACVMVGATSAPVGAVDNLIIGACDAAITATLSGGHVGLSMPSRAACDVTNKEEVVEVSFVAPTLTAPANTSFGCAGGEAEGFSTFTIYGDGAPWSQFDGADTHVLSTGGVVTIAVVDVGAPPNASLLASGTFLQSPSAVACDDDTTTLTWSGTLTFFDPVI